MSYWGYVSSLCLTLYAAYVLQLYINGSVVQYTLCKNHMACKLDYPDSAWCNTLLPWNSFWYEHCSDLATRMQRIACADNWDPDPATLRYITRSCTEHTEMEPEDAAYTSCVLDGVEMIENGECPRATDGCYETLMWLRCEVQLWTGKYSSNVKRNMSNASFAGSQ